MRREVEKVYFVASKRNHQTGVITYEIFDNLGRLPRGYRSVFGTGSLSLDVVRQRLSQCEKGVWFKNEHNRRRRREAEDNNYRKKLHEKFLNRGRKTGFDWSKYEKMMKA